MIQRYFKILLFLTVFSLITIYYFYHYFILNWSSKKNSEEFIENTSFTACNVFIDSRQPSVLIDGERYPKHVPLFLNSSINFQCLNERNKAFGNRQILLWTAFQGEPMINYLEQLVYTKDSRDVLDQLRCPVNNCKLTLNRTLANESDLIVFHLRSNIDKWPVYRPPNQRWVHMIYESPVHCYKCDKYEGVFNLTASYRTDSDFTSIYYTKAGIDWSEMPKSSAIDVYSSKKNAKFSATLISSCGYQTARSAYINELKKHINIDIYGKCGQNCPPIIDCREHIANSYKFFFVFENSLCKDYITEKVFEAVKFDIVPVVLGKFDFDFWIPKSAYINALDFNSQKDLADFLLKLDKDPVAYNKFFEWKKYLRVNKDPPIFAPLCEMCIKLNLEQITGVVEHKVLNNAFKMFNNTQNCWPIDVDHSKILLGQNLTNAFFSSPETTFDRY